LEAAEHVELGGVVDVVDGLVDGLFGEV